MSVIGISWPSKLYGVNINPRKYLREIIEAACHKIENISDEEISVT